MELQARLELDRPHLAVVGHVREGLRQVRLRREGVVVPIDRVVQELDRLGGRHVVRGVGEAARDVTVHDHRQRLLGRRRPGCRGGWLGAAPGRGRGGRRLLRSAARRDKDGAAGQQAEEAFVHQLSSEKRVPDPMSPATGGIPRASVRTRGSPTDRDPLGASLSRGTSEASQDHGTGLAGSLAATMRRKSTGCQIPDPGGVGTPPVLAAASPGRESPPPPSAASAGSADGPRSPRRGAGPARRAALR